jgi:hypothetical protein
MRIYRITSEGRTLFFVAATSLGRAKFLAWQGGRIGLAPRDYEGTLIGTADTTDIFKKNGEGILEHGQLCGLLDTQNPMPLFDRQRP